MKINMYDGCALIPCQGLRVRHSKSRSKRFKQCKLSAFSCTHGIRSRLCGGEFNKLTLEHMVRCSLRWKDFAFRPSPCFISPSMRQQSLPNDCNCPKYPSKITSCIPFVLCHKGQHYGRQTFVCLCRCCCFFFHISSTIFCIIIAKYITDGQNSSLDIKQELCFLHGT